jgi:hypothetical protein
MITSNATPRQTNRPPSEGIRPSLSGECTERDGDVGNRKGASQSAGALSPVAGSRSAWAAMPSQNSGEAVQLGPGGMPRACRTVRMSGMLSRASAAARVGLSAASLQAGDRGARRLDLVGRALTRIGVTGRPEEPGHSDFQDRVRSHMISIGP